MLVATLTVGIAIGWSTALLRADSEPSTWIYELRTYTTNEGRMPALNARFRDHTMKLFEKHGMKNVIYCTPIDADGKPVDDKLVYLLAHKSVESAKKSFAEFGNDPEWIAARDASHKDGKIVSKVESQYLVPTEYSPMK
jgi:hypothetical protein